MAKVTIGKQGRTPPGFVNKDGSPNDLTHYNQLCNISDVDFREEILRMFKEINETMEWIAHIM